MKVADKNHLDMSDFCDKVRDKLVCVVLIKFSLLQYTWKVGDKVKVRGLCHRHKSQKFVT